MIWASVALIAGIAFGFWGGANYAAKRITRALVENTAVRREALRGLKYNPAEGRWERRND